MSLGTPALTTTAVLAVAGWRRDSISLMGYCCRVRAAALKVTSRGSVCVLAGGTVAQPQLMRRLPPSSVGYSLSLLA